jgi:hypothetical protein
MRLSEALLLGSTLGETLKNDSYRSCLLGVACRAIGKENGGNDEVKTRWPWTEEWKFTHPVMGLTMLIPLRYVLTRMCDRVLDGTMSIDDVVAYVRSVEPSEPDHVEVPGVPGRVPLETKREHNFVEEKA